MMKPQESHTPDPEEKPFGPGFAAGTIKIVGDVMAPIDVEWDAMHDDIHWDPTKNVEPKSPSE